jgi:hypothetical protein
MEREERAVGFAMLHLDNDMYPQSFEFDIEMPNYPMEGLTLVGIIWHS